MNSQEHQEVKSRNKDGRRCSARPDTGGRKGREGKGCGEAVDDNDARRMFGGGWCNPRYVCSNLLRRTDNVVQDERELHAYLCMYFSPSHGER